MADISYLRPTGSYEKRLRAYDRLGSRGRFRGPRVPIVLGLALLVAGAAAAMIVLGTASASISANGPSLATVGMPLGGGKLERVTVTTGSHATPVPVVVRGDEIWPRTALRVGQRLSVVAVVKRPGWISWLSGSTERVTLATATPAAHLRSRFLSLSNGMPLRVAFDKPVRTVTYGAIEAVHRRVLSTPVDTVTLPRNGRAGSVLVAGAPRSWERAQPEPVSWFPAGLARASAVADPNPGARLTPVEPITLTFSKPVASVLGRSHPAISPHAAGSWKVLSSHTISFQPSGYGYGLGATVRLGLPAGVALVGGKNGGRGAVATWTVPSGSIVRLHQLLAQLGYLPVNFHYSGAAPDASAQAQLTAAVDPPKGTFSWRYPNTPAALHSDWSPTASGVMTQGAIMAFESDHNMYSGSPASEGGGAVTPALWRALIKAAVANQRSTSGYTFVTVSEGSPETETTWHNGRVVVHGLVNTGIPSAPTAQGTFPTFTHNVSVTMSGTNPDGSAYSDPGIPWVSYFNGGDALHGFIRASYGFPQSLGCVEMPFSEAHKVWGYTPIGTLVNVVG